MADPETPAKELDEKHVDKIVKFVSEIRNGKLHGSNKIASETVTLLEQIINESQNATAFELCSVIRETGRRLVRALPHELVCANMVRRVLRAIRDESRQAFQSGGSGGAGAAGGGESLQRLVQAAPARRDTLPAHCPDLRAPLREHIAELRLELESWPSLIWSTAREHVHADELILSCGHSDLVERFLRTCLQRRFRLLLAETSADTRETHAMAARLSGAGAAVTVITNASVYAVMSRVNKVVMSVHATLGGGALLAGGGAHAVTLAAKHYSVPVVVLCPLLLLSPQHAAPRAPPPPAAPHHALSYGSETQGSSRVLSPRYDYIPPDHVTLFITNLGGSSPSYMYRLLSELYDPRDYNLD